MKKAREVALDLSQQSANDTTSNLPQMVTNVNDFPRGKAKRHLGLTTLRALACGELEVVSSINLDLLSANDALIVREIIKLKVPFPGLVSHTDHLFFMIALSLHLPCPFSPFRPHHHQHLR